MFCYSRGNFLLTSFKVWETQVQSKNIISVESSLKTLHTGYDVVFFTEALSSNDIPKLKTDVVDVIPPEVFEDMSVTQLQVKTLICVNVVDKKGYTDDLHLPFVDT